MNDDMIDQPPDVDQLRSAEQQIAVIRELMDRMYSEITELLQMGPKDILAPTATFFKALVDLNDDLKEVYKPVYHYMNHYQQKILPDLFRFNSVVETKTMYGHNVKMVEDFNVTIPAEMKPAAYQWLETNGYGDIISSTINASTLKATMKSIKETATVVPGDIFKMSDFIKMSVTSPSKKIPTTSRGSVGDF